MTGLVIRGIQDDSWFLAERYVAIWLFFEFAKARNRYAWFIHLFHYEHLSRTFYVSGPMLNAAVWCYQVVPFVPHSPSQPHPTHLPSCHPLATQSCSLPSPLGVTLALFPHKFPSPHPDEDGL